MDDTASMASDHVWTTFDESDPDKPETEILTWSAPWIAEGQVKDVSTSKSELPSAQPYHPRRAA